MAVRSSGIALFRELVLKKSDRDIPEKPGNKKSRSCCCGKPVAFTPSHPGEKVTESMSDTSSRVRRPEKTLWGKKGMQ